MKRAFTLLELMVVMVVLSILMTLVVISANASIASARDKRTEAMRVVLEAGINAYYGATGKWPGPLESLAQNGGSNSTVLDYKGASQQVFQEVVKASVRRGNPAHYLSPAALFVAPARTKNGKGTGLDFNAARMKGERGRAAIGVSQMHFGYQDRDTGKFRRFRIHYNPATDSINVVLTNGKALTEN